MNEVVETVALIRDRVRAHLIVDADTGYGNALNVERTIRLLERAGANAIQIEDQDFPKRCGHLDDKVLIPASEMAGKIKAARRAPFRRNLGNCPHRCHRRRGSSIARWRALSATVRPAPTCSLSRRPRRAPSSSVFRPRSKACPWSRTWWRAAKRRRSARPNSKRSVFHVIFPGGIVRALARTASDYYASLAAHGTTEPFVDRMYDFTALNDVIGTPALTLGKRYEAVAGSHGTKDHGK